MKDPSSQAIKAKDLEDKWKWDERVKSDADKRKEALDWFEKEKRAQQIALDDAVKRW